MPKEGFRISFLTRPLAPRFGRWREKPPGVSGIFRRPCRNIPQFDLSLSLKSDSYQGTPVAENRSAVVSKSERVKEESNDYQVAGCVWRPDPRGAERFCVEGGSRRWLDAFQRRRSLCERKRASALLAVGNYSAG